MSDWRQIQARIRKAKASSDPPGHLTALYEKTHDAMVAYELAVLQEKAGQIADAVGWYTTAAERFRRPQWKTKAEDALARLGASVPSGVAAPPASQERALSRESVSGLPERLWATPQPSEPAGAFEEPVAEQGSLPLRSTAPEATEEVEAPGAPAGQHRRRRRGRRGGRGRRRRGAAEVASTPATAPVPPARPHELPGRHLESGSAREQPGMAERVPARPIGSGREEETAHRVHEPARSPEPVVGPAVWQARGRAGEPALASRLVQLESQVRRLLACPPRSLAEAEHAPAGPGVFIVSDSDQITYYYVEACQTLRVGIANLLRAERGVRRGGEPLRTRFADHLGISESRVSKYLKEHCVVRWLQLDEGAGFLAHFTIAVLRPALNE